MARLALHGLELVHVGDGRAARLLVPGHVARHAVEIELLVLLGEGRVGARVRRVLPELVRLVVAARARFHADVRCVSLLCGQRHAILESLAVVIVHAAIVALHARGNGRRGSEPLPDLHRAILKEAPLLGRRGRGDLRKLSLEPIELLSPSSDVGGGCTVRLPFVDAALELGDATGKALSPLGIRYPRAVLESERATHEQVEHRDALQMVRRLDDDGLTDLCRRKGRIVPLALVVRLSHDHRVEAGHLLGEPERTAAIHRDERDEDLRTLLLELPQLRLERSPRVPDLHAGWAAERPGRVAGPREADPVPAHRDDARRFRASGGTVQISGEQVRVSGALEALQLRGARRPIVLARRPRKKTQIAERSRERLGFPEVLRCPRRFAQRVEKQHGPGSNDQRVRRVLRLRPDERGGMIDPAELVFRATARLERARSGGDDVEAERGLGRDRTGSFGASSTGRRHRERRKEECERSGDAKRQRHHGLGANGRMLLRSSSLNRRFRPTK